MREQDVNSEATFNTIRSPKRVRASHRPLISEIRVSRLRQPRATTLAIVLLATVFLLFGMVAAAMEPAHPPMPTSAEGVVNLIASWAVHR